MDEIDADADGRNEEQTMFVNKDNVHDNFCQDEAWKYFRYCHTFPKC